MRQTCLNMVYELAKRDRACVFIGSDLSPGLLDDMKQEMPERWYMEGITEANVIGMAAGLAMEGYIPYVNTIATFITRRCYEQVAVDLCLHDLPVRLIANGGGLVYAPLGPTHLAIEDIAIMRALPNMTVTAVCDAEEMMRLMDCTLDWPHPIYIRLAKGGDPVVSRDENGFAIGKAIPMRKARSQRRDRADGDRRDDDELPRRRRAPGQGRHRRLGACTSTPSSRSTRRRCSNSRTAPRWSSPSRRASRIGGFGSAVTDLLVEQARPAMPPIDAARPARCVPAQVRRAGRSVRDLRPDARADRRQPSARPCEERAGAR